MCNFFPPHSFLLRVSVHGLRWQPAGDRGFVPARVAFFSILELHLRRDVSLGLRVLHAAPSVSLLIGEGRRVMHITGRIETAHKLGPQAIHDGFSPAHIKVT